LTISLHSLAQGREPTHREPDVARLMNFFCNFPSTKLQSHQQHHAAPEVALTVKNSMLLKEKIQTFTIV